MWRYIVARNILCVCVSIIFLDIFRMYFYQIEIFGKTNCCPCSVVPYEKAQPEHEEHVIYISIKSTWYQRFSISSVRFSGSVFFYWYRVIRLFDGLSNRVDRWIYIIDNFEQIDMLCLSVWLAVHISNSRLIYKIVWSVRWQPNITYHEHNVRMQWQPNDILILYAYAHAQCLFGLYLIQ